MATLGERKLKEKKEKQRCFKGFSKWIGFDLKLVPPCDQ